MSQRYRSLIYILAFLPKFHFSAIIIMESANLIRNAVYPFGSLAECRLPSTEMLTNLLSYLQSAFSVYFVIKTDSTE